MRVVEVTSRWPNGCTRKAWRRAVEIREPVSGKLCKSYKELYGTRIKSLADETDKMRKIQKEVKSKYEPAKEQMAMLADCQRLLQCKRHCLRLSKQARIHMHTCKGDIRRCHLAQSHIQCKSHIVSLDVETDM